MSFTKIYMLRQSAYHVETFATLVSIVTEKIIILFFELYERLYYEMTKLKIFIHSKLYYFIIIYYMNHFLRYIVINAVPTNCWVETTFFYILFPLYLYCTSTIDVFFLYSSSSLREYKIHPSYLYFIHLNITQFKPYFLYFLSCVHIHQTFPSLLLLYTNIGQVTFVTIAFI